MELKKHWLPLLVLMLLGLWAMRTFWGPNFYDGHDAQAHIVRLYQYDLAVKDGQVPPRWAPTLLAGRGYPVFIFAYPLPYAVAEAFHLLGFNLAVSLKLTFVLAYLVSTVGMYVFAAQYWRSRLAGFLSGLLWSFAPYTFVKIFITASLGVVVSYAFIPWFFLSLYLLLNKPNLRYSLYLVLAASGWILSHEITPLVFSPLIILFTLFHCKKKPIKYIGLALVLTFGLTAWFLLPALWELKYTHFHELVVNQYANQFVELKRLLYSKWGTGAPGWSNNPLSQQVGAAQWLAVGLAVVYSWKVKKILPFLISFGLSIFLMLKISKPIWDIVPLLPLVHIPWRFLSLAVFSSAIAAGRIRHPWLVALIVILAIYGNRNHLRINEVRVYTQEFFQNYTGVATGWNEHLPIWVKDLNLDPDVPRLEVVDGDCQAEELQRKSTLQLFKVNCNQPSIAQLNTAYYPGWQVVVDADNITNEVKNNLDQSNGMMRFNLDPGYHQIEAKFLNTPLRQIALAISGLAFVSVVWLLKK